MAEKHLRKSDDDHLSCQDNSAPSSGTTQLARADADRVVDLDVSWLKTADLTAVDALARLQLAATQRAHWLQLHGADQELVELLELVGLSDIVHLCPSCRWSVSRDAPPTCRT